MNVVHYSATEEVEIEIVAYGPGLHVLKEDASPVQSAGEIDQREHANVAFSACGNTSDAIKKAEGKEIQLVTQARIVPGVVRLMELQENGWSYVRP